jgi:GxxExxY protein
MEFHLSEPQGGPYKDDLIYKDDSYKIIGICMEIHRILGRGFSEIVYKDAMHQEFIAQKIMYEREKKYAVEYKGIILPHSFIADFVYDSKIILEVKAQNGIVDDFYVQTLNYLAVSKLKLGLIINFGEDSLKVRRAVL